MNLQEKKDYVLENLHFVPEEEKNLFDFNFVCVLTRNSVGMESGKRASLEEVVSIIRGYHVRVDETLKRSVYNHYKAYNMMLKFLNENKDTKLTEEFLKDALDAYLLKYGKCTVVDNYMVFFEPLGVVDMNYGIE